MAVVVDGVPSAVRRAHLRLSKPEGLDAHCSVAKGPLLAVDLHGARDRAGITNVPGDAIIGLADIDQRHAGFAVPRKARSWLAPSFSAIPTTSPRMLIAWA